MIKVRDGNKAVPVPKFPWRKCCPNLSKQHDMPELYHPKFPKFTFQRREKKLTKMTNDENRPIYSATEIKVSFSIFYQNLQSQSTVLIHIPNLTS